jgi:hypothetical protein
VRFTIRQIMPLFESAVRQRQICWHPVPHGSTARRAGATASFVSGEVGQ